LNLNKKSSLNDDNLKPHYEHTENNYISLTEEAYSPRFIQQEFDEKHMKIPCVTIYRLLSKIPIVIRCREILQNQPKVILKVTLRISFYQIMITLNILLRLY
jgi:hypothetical protein